MLLMFGFGIAKSNIGEFVLHLSYYSSENEGQDEILLSLLK